MTITNFDDALKNAAQAYARGFGTSLRFVDYTGLHKDVLKYVESGIYTPASFSTGLVSYSKPQFDPDKARVFQNALNNDTDSEGNLSHTFTSTNTDTFSFGFTEGISIGASATIGVEVSAEPIGVGGKVTGSTTFSTNLNFSSNQQTTKTNTQTLSSTVSVGVKPHRRVELEWIVTNRTYKMPFSAPVRVTRQVAIWLKDRKNINDPRSKKDTHHLWFVQVGEVFRHRIAPGFTVLNNGLLEFTSRGFVDAKYFLGGEATATGTGPAVSSEVDGLVLPTDSVITAPAAAFPIGVPALPEPVVPTLVEEAA